MINSDSAFFPGHAIRPKSRLPGRFGDSNCCLLRTNLYLFKKQFGRLKRCSRPGGNAAILGKPRAWPEAVTYEPNSWSDLSVAGAIGVIRRK
jgi:hypothetical protein